MPVQLHNVTGYRVFGVGTSIARVVRFLPLALILLGAICSLCFSFLILPHIAGPLAVNPDPDKLGELGRNLAEGHGFSYGTGASLAPAFDRGPVYPLLVMILTWLAGGYPLALIQIAQAVVHGCTGFLLYRLGIELLDRRTALLAQAVHAVHPILLWYTARIWIETTNTLLVTALALSLILLWKRPTRFVLAGTGLLLALAALTKSTVLAVPLALLGVALARKEWRYARSLALVTVIGVLLISPWTLRNFLLSGRWIPVHTSLGLNLVQGEAIGEEWLQMPFSTLAIWEKGRAQMEHLLAAEHLRPESPNGDAFLIRAVLRRWWTNPVTLFRHAATNAITYWYLSESPLKSWGNIVLQVPLLLLATAGIRGMMRKGSAAWIPVVYISSFWLTHALVVGWLRYSVPALPLMILFAVAGAGHIHTWQRRSVPASAPPVQ